jgi:hypothetical protein
MCDPVQGATSGVTCVQVATLHAKWEGALQVYPPLLPLRVTIVEAQAEGHRIVHRQGQAQKGEGGAPLPIPAWPQEKGAPLHPPSCVGAHHATAGVARGGARGSRWGSPTALLLPTAPTQVHGDLPCCCQCKASTSVGLEIHYFLYFQIT